MWNPIRGVLLLAAGLGQLACTEGTSPRAPTRDLELMLPGLDRMRASLLVTDEPYAGGDVSPPSEALPLEFQQAPSIIDYRTDAGFGSAHAWAQGYMRYYATHARQLVELALRYNGSSVANVKSPGGESDLLPADRTLLTSASILVGKSCGHASQASTNHSAWHQFPLVGRWLRWGDTDRGSQDGDAQPPCEADTGSDGGGGGGPVVYVCYCMDFYDASSGQWVHGGIIYCLEA